ncbi:unnamed protein product [Brassica oleracea var. botrytis]
MLRPRSKSCISTKYDDQFISVSLLWNQNQNKTRRHLQVVFLITPCQLVGS